MAFISRKRGSQCTEWIFAATLVIFLGLVMTTVADPQRQRPASNPRPTTSKRPTEAISQQSASTVSTSQKMSSSVSNSASTKPQTATAPPSSSQTMSMAVSARVPSQEQGDVKKMDALKTTMTTMSGSTLSKRTTGVSEEDSLDDSSSDEDDSRSSNKYGTTDFQPTENKNVPAVNNNKWSDRTAYTRLINMTRVDHIEAECQDDFMKIFIRFNGTFDGLIYSSGYSYDPDCIYINGSGKSDYEFFIQLNRCGTLGGNNHDTVDKSRNQPSKSFMWNTVTIQYNMMIEEEWDEHFKVTCEYGYDFWKTVTFPMLDVQVATGNPVVFTLTPPECHMEIRYGYGITGNRITGPVRVGDPLTLVIYMRSQYEGFDMVVNNCFAHNGAQKKIPLIDRFGCPVDEKLISSFQGTWTNDGVYETQVYAYMKAFRFTGSPALYLECEVRMCHGYCPSQPCHWRSAGRRKRDLPALGHSSGSHHVAGVPSLKSGPYVPYPGFPRQARLTRGDDIEFTDEEEDGFSQSGSASNVTTISLFQALQVLKDVPEDELPADTDDEANRNSASGTRSQSDVQKGGFSPDSENFCIKTGVFTALLGVCSLMILLMATACCFLFMRMRKSSSTQEKIEPQHDFVAPRRRLR